MKYGMVMPRKYIQGDGALDDLGHYVMLCGKKALLVWSKSARKATFEQVTASLEKFGAAYDEWLFAGESTEFQAKQVQKKAMECGADVIVGLGGGKVLDTAKGVAGWMKLPVIIAPTVAATDAPWTSTSGWYNDEGIMTDIYVAPFNPDILLVDTGVIVRAPIRLFVAGMGDGITTHLEVKMAYASRSTDVNRSGCVPTMATRVMSELCYNILLDDGEEAIDQVKQQLVTPLVDRVVETMVLHSGVGGESGGIAAAHSIANNLPYFKENQAYYHGENVAFGVVSQFMLDDVTPLCEIKRVVDWMIRVGLPVTMDEIGIGGKSRDELNAFSEYCINSPVSFFRSMVTPLNAKKLTEAMLAADDFGKRRKLLMNSQIQ